jgi:hypothetical protein
MRPHKRQHIVDMESYSMSILEIKKSSDEYKHTDNVIREKRELIFLHLHLSLIPHLTSLTASTINSKKATIFTH